MQLRFWITKQRVHNTLQELPATSYERQDVLLGLVDGKNSDNFPSVSDGCSHIHDR